MDNKTIKTVVNYQLNQAGRIAMAKLGLPAQEKQSITLDMPLDTPGLQIDSDGIGYMSFNYIYHPELKTTNDYYNAESNPRIYHWKVYLYSNATNGIPTPLLSVKDVLDFATTQKAKEDTITAQIPIAQATEDARYETAIKEQITQNKIRNEVRNQLEIKYQNAAKKLGQITDLINGKTRVRTSQIQAIISN
jgi:hypothetical protein